ncbi:chemotaxis protein CheA [Thiocystis violacea]|uniref:chemotaxis protein CheA n=1 Tax=Thiocystis violacea TaxID=13725 RepID=UPI001905C75A|nr:chemotaxis protein CheA [Thiocystis violacea]MBK1720696.1 chemotaxis protein CheA [Thiocystis violacea]
MSPLLEQFLSEARDFLQGIGEKLMQLEAAPADADLMNELFRLVHTLKGNSGLFDAPEMTRVLHAGEDLMDAVRNGRVAYSRPLADRLLDAMDFVGMLCDELESDGQLGAAHAGDSVRLVDALRHLLQPDDAPAEAPAPESTPESAPAPTASLAEPTPVADTASLPLASIPEAVRMQAYRRACAGEPLSWLAYRPHEQCFYQGDDPFFLARQTPELLWSRIEAREPWPPLAELDAYSCMLDFQLLTAAPRAALEEQYRYVMDQVQTTEVPRLALVMPQGDPNGGPVYDDFAADARRLLQTGDLEGLARNASTLLELSSPDLWIASALRWLQLVLETEPENKAILDALVDCLGSLAAPQWGTAGAAETHTASASTSIRQDPAPRNERGQEAEGVADASDEATPALSPLAADALAAVVAAQGEVLALTDEPRWLPGRLKAAAAALSGCLRATGATAKLQDLEAATAAALARNSGAPLLTWIAAVFPAELVGEPGAAAPVTAAPPSPAHSAPQPPEAEGEIKFGRRAEDAISGPKSLKVDQAKIDRLMNLIGEMVVAKNALPYLAGRAEAVFGVRELAREIKGHYGVINRIAEEMQGAIMQIRMMPVSFVFQRFPRLVRDISRKLGKEVELILEGEDTEADKTIIESLGDPLMHIVRNSLDHGIESPELRRAAGKPATGTLRLRAMQESDRVVIEISDDGKGIDPDIIKRKAYAKGLIDETLLEQISDQEAVNLVFAAGFSTTEVISDLSGRGVGMDVVRTAVEKVNGSVALTSQQGRGTQIRLSLPLSMAVTNVMIVVSDGQRFGVPMDRVVETVRVPRAAIRTIKHSLATVLRGRIVPLKSINDLLGLSAPPKANADDELAVLVVRLGDESLGLLVDDFSETLDIILKPMTGVLAGLPAYAGSALMGDGSVLMVLNVKEIL